MVPSQEFDQMVAIRRIGEEVIWNDDAAAPVLAPNGPAFGLTMLSSSSLQPAPPQSLAG
jgi:hypothetical protein